MSALDLVMPLIARDRERFHTFLASYKKFWKVNGLLRLFVPEAEYAALKDLAGLDSRIRVDTKQSLIGTVPYELGVQGWQRQQYVKLAAFQAVDTPFYCCVDSDMFVTRELRYDDVIMDGRAPVRMTDKAKLVSLYTNAGHLLGALDEDGLVPEWQVTWCPPFFFAQQIAHACKTTLEGIYAKDWITVLAEYAVSRRALRGTMPLADTIGEAQFYHVVGMRSRLWESCHREQTAGFTDDVMFRWHPEKTLEGWNVWDPAKTFNNNVFMFGVVHSFTSVPPAEVFQRIKPFLA